MERNILQELKVGLAVLGTLLLIGVAVFVLGGSTDLLETRYRLNASYTDISGLREGAVVRLAGIDVGEVTRIQFSEDPKERRVFVQFNIMERYRNRIREDSLASIQTEGVLGDKYISISMGSPSEPVLMHGDWIGTSDPLEFLSYMNKASEILDNTAGISRKVNFLLGEDQDSARASLANAILTLEALMKEVEEGRGLIHALIYDQQLARSVQQSLANLEEGSATFARMALEVEQGEGLAHELIYGDEGRRLATQLGDLAATLESLASDIQDEESLVHALIYDPERTKMLEDLHEAAASLRAVTEAVEEGKGTLGLLANDPELYQDLRALLGGAQRNRLLRGYIRRTVEEAEEEDASGWEPVAP